MKETLYPHQSVWVLILALVLFVIGFIAFVYNFLLGYLYPPISDASTWCCTSTYMAPAYTYNWNLIVGIFLMVTSIFITWWYGVSIESTPADIEKQIKHHEDIIAKLRGVKK